MRNAIPRFRSRIAELSAVDVSLIQRRSDPDLGALRQKVESTLADVFGAHSVEYEQFGGVRLDTAPVFFGRETSLQAVRQGYAHGVKQTIAKLETVVALLEEKLGSTDEGGDTRARRAFGDLVLHPEIGRAVTSLFESGHYANAVEDGCKVLDVLVKMRSGRHDLSGTDLMQVVFSPKNPVLRFSGLQTDSEKSEQQGMMFLYAGAMLALRNPRAHGLLPDTAESAIEYLGLVSLLAKALDRATRA